MKDRFVYALGFFDGVHLGHRALLKACGELAALHRCGSGAVTFGTHPDALVRGNAPRLIGSLAQRRELLEAFPVDRVVELPFDQGLRSMPWEDFLGLLRREYHAAGFVCGADFRFGHKGAGTAALLEEYCRQELLPWAIVPEQKLDGVTVSSTHIRALLEAGDVENANRFLGHPHRISGEVISGRQLGRTIGIPTANLLLPPQVLCPRHGVYACVAQAEGMRYAAVTNIGSRPTVGGHRVTVEPWLLDFSADLYGKPLTLEFYAFLRPEKRFASIQALREAILEDAAKTRRLLPHYPQKSP